MHCAFCRIPPDKHLVENEHFFAIRDIHPVTRGHCLVVAKRHVKDFFELDPDEMQAFHAICVELRDILDREYQPAAYNLGMNCGSEAGQSVFHFHLHFIPRFAGERRPLQGLREYIKEIL